jgi:hypothetical protein
LSGDKSGAARTVLLGAWAAKPTIVDRAWGEAGGSAAVSLAFVQALGKAGGQKNLKMCFVHKDGYDTACRSSTDGSMLLASYDSGNPKLAAVGSDKLAYTFGRLGGLAWSVDGYVYSTYQPYVQGLKQIALSQGLVNEFGTQGSLVEIGQPDGWYGVWHGAGSGMCYRPSLASEDELGNKDAGSNPSPNTYGFRLYVGP